MGDIYMEVTRQGDLIVVVDEKRYDAHQYLTTLRAALALLGAECRAWRKHDLRENVRCEDADCPLAVLMTATDSSPTAAAAVKGST